RERPDLTEGLPILTAGRLTSHVPPDCRAAGCGLSIPLTSQPAALLAKEVDYDPFSDINCSGRGTSLGRTDARCRDREPSRTALRNGVPAYGQLGLSGLSSATYMDLCCRRHSLRLR